MKENKREVVITGIGIISPIGCSVDEVVQNLLIGKSGRSAISRFSTEAFPVKEACEVPGFTGDSSSDDYFVQFGLEAALQAYNESGIAGAGIDPERFSLVVSSSKGGVACLERGQLQGSWPHELNARLAKMFGVRGIMKCQIAACATGTISLIDAVHLIERNETDFCLAGASDASITPLMLAAYHRLGAYSPRGIHPFSKNRTGFIVGEGACVLALEAKEHARARGKKEWASIVATEMAAAPYRMTSFNRQGDDLSRLILRLMKSAGLGPGDLDYLNAHGTATTEGDLYETEQIKQALGAHAGGLSISSTKSMTGHMLGASGAFEAAACAIALKHGFVPPTIGFEERDPECDLDYTANKAVKKELRHAISISMGFGGQLGGLIMKL